MTFQSMEVEDDEIVVINLPERVGGEIADQLKTYSGKGKIQTGNESG